MTILCTENENNKIITQANIQSLLSDLNVNFNIFDPKDISKIPVDSFIFLFDCDSSLIQQGERSQISEKSISNCNNIVGFGKQSFASLSLKSFMSELASSPYSLILIIIISFITQIFTLAVPLLFQQIIDKVIGQENIDLLPVLITVMIGAALLAGTFRAGRQLLIFDVADRADRKFSEILLQNLLSLDYSFFGFNKKGDIAGRVGEVSSIRSFVTGPAITTVLDLVFSLAYLVILIIYSINLRSFHCSDSIFIAIIVKMVHQYTKIICSEIISGITAKLQGFLANQ